MWHYLIKRTLLTLPTFVGIILLTFVIIHLTPGSPSTASPSGFNEPGMNAEEHARIRAHFELDAPLHRRFAGYMLRMVRFDFGHSIADGRPVIEKITERVCPTLLLASVTIGVALLLVIPVALFTALHVNSRFDRFVMWACVGFYAIPPYVLGMVLMLVVGVSLQWLPFSGLTSDNYGTMSSFQKLGDIMWHSVLIACCFIYPLVAFLIPFVRSSVLSVLNEDYVRAAFARGMTTRRVMVRHVLPNALLPLLTALGLIIPSMLGGSVVLEVMFAWPGMGRLLYEAMLRRDYPVIMGMTIVSGVIVLGITLVVDLLYAWADPRVRYA